MSVRIATAEWADPEEVEQRYLYRDGTVWLGRSTVQNQVPIGYRDDRHVCVVSGSRGGKGTTSIVNNLILWPGSICVVDPKGENATITAARRGRGSEHCKGLDQAVQVLDPFNAAQVDESLRGRFNPLDALDPDGDETIDEAGRIADAIVVIHEGKNADPFWDESARAMVKGIILHVLTAPQYAGRRNLITVRKLILRGDSEAVEELRAQGEKNLPSGQALLWSGMINNPAFDGLIAGIGDSFLGMFLNGAKQYDSVLQVANRNTEFMDSPAMQRCLEASDFKLSGLKTRPEGLSLYLCLPQRYMSTHYRWLRMMIALTVTEMEKVRGQPATGHPVLMVLDEFAGLKRMEVIENAVAQIAGYGVKLFFVLQSLEQLKAVYQDNWETFLANSGLKVFFNLEDNFSREYVSKLIGETEVIREVRSSSDSESKSESVSKSTTRSRSETTGRSRSDGTSESDGTNSSVNTGKSWGANWGESSSQNYTYAQGWIFRHYDRQRIGDGRSQSSGRSVTQSEGKSHGVSHGTSKSRTDGTSESSTTGTSETEGTTYGTSQSRTAGTSETIQKRALITPDEIGQVFARIDDRGHQAYPGLMLVVISGARPLAVRRVNYYEDFQFIGLFDPHPDFPFTGPKELTVEGRALGLPLSHYGLRISGWSIAAGQVAPAGGEAAAVTTENGTPAACIRVPRAGLIKTVRALTGSDVEQGPLFSLLYYEDGAELTDPFAEVRAFCERERAALEAGQREADEKRRAEDRRRRTRKYLVNSALACCALLAIIAVVAGVGNVKKKVEISPESAGQQGSVLSPDTRNPENPPASEVRPPTSQAVPSDVRVTLTPLYTLEHPNPYGELTLAFSPDSRLLASASITEETIKLWEIASGTELRTVTAGGASRLHSLAFSPDGRILASGDSATIRLWDVATGTEVGKIRAPAYAMSLSPDGRMFAFSGEDKTIRLWNQATGSELGAYAGQENTVSSLAFSPDGRLLASGHTNNTIYLWDVAAGTELHILSHGDTTPGSHDVEALAFSPDGRILASGSSDKTITLWDPASGTELRTLAGHTDLVISLAFSPDSRILASAGRDNTVRLWNPATGTELGAYAAGESVAFSPNGRFLASGGAQIKVWNITVK